MGGLQTGLAPVQRECLLSVLRPPGPAQGAFCPCAVLPHLLQGDKFILSTGPQGELLFIPGGWAGRNISIWLGGSELALVSSLREGAWGAKLPLTDLVP